MIDIKLPMLDMYNPDSDSCYQLAPLMLQGYNYEQDQAVIEFRVNPALDYKIFSEDGRLVISAFAHKETEESE